MNPNVNNALTAAEETGKAVEGSVISDILNFISNYGPKIIWALIALVFMLIISKIIAKIVRKNIISHSTWNVEHTQKIADLIRDLVFYVMVGFSVFIAFEIVGLDVWLLLWGISFGIWLAFKEVLGNMIAGIMILYTKQFRLWDVVEVQADQDYFGRIEEITIRYTIIRTLDLRQVVLPNLKLISVPIKTFSSEELVKLTINIGVHYDSDITKATQVTINAINSFEFVKQKENTKVFVTNFWDSSIDLACKFLFDPNCGMTGNYAIGLVNEGINTSYNTNGIKIPYPHKTITFNSNVDKQKVVQQTKPPAPTPIPTPTPPPSPTPVPVPTPNPVTVNPVTS